MARKCFFLYQDRQNALESMVIMLFHYTSKYNQSKRNKKKKDKKRKGKGKRAKRMC
jgi:hypothetical protein